MVWWSTDHNGVRRSMEARVTVFDNAFYEGFSGEEEELYALQYGAIAPLKDVLRHRWATDAHMALYSIPGETELPRLNKPRLRWFQARSQTFIPELTTMAIDVDIPGHGDPFSWHNLDKWPASD